MISRALALFAFTLSDVRGSESDPFYLSTSIACQDSGGLGFVKQRGLTLVASTDGEDTFVRYISTENGAPTLDLNPLATLTAPYTARTSSNSLTGGGNHITGNMLFHGVVDDSTFNYGNVFIYRGEFSTWTLAQTLSPPAEYYEQSWFGYSVDLDLYDFQTLAVGCGGCNVTANEGLVYVYEPTSPSSRFWTQSAALRAAPGVFGVGNDELQTNRNILLASGSTDESDTGKDNILVLWQRKSVGSPWSQTQTLVVGTTGEQMNIMSIWDETIVVGVQNEMDRGFSAGAVFVYYPSTRKFNLHPKGKPQPVQWSVQQVLYRPDVAPASNGDDFGSYLSVDENSMVVAWSGTGGSEWYVFEREHVSGKWSFQQKMLDGVDDDADRVEMGGDTFVTINDDSMEVYDRSRSWDCLLVSVEDHMGDGWDTAKLNVQVPGGEQDNFYPRCDMPNPLQFRYCPARKEEGGLYRFSITDTKKAKFPWEIVWRVFEESTGMWYTGNFNSEMDFDWDAKKGEFSHRRLHSLLPNNITCKTCRTRPTSKPSPSRLRALKHEKSSTTAPTLSPAPTLHVNVGDDWRVMTLTAGGSEWFDAQHKGTSYYISDKAGHRLLSTGTLCPGEATGKQCWEDLPDGEYILRLGGALDMYGSNNLFSYCKMANNLATETQMTFRITNDDCEVLTFATKAAICEHDIDIQLILTLEFEVVGLTAEEFTSHEQRAFALALVYNLAYIGADDIHVTHVTELSADILSVGVKFDVSALRAHADFLDADSYDAFLTEFRARFSLMSPYVAAVNAVDPTLSKIRHLYLQAMHAAGTKEVAVVGANPQQQLVTNMVSLASNSEKSTSDTPDEFRHLLVVMGAAVALVVSLLLGMFLIRKK